MCDGPRNRRFERWQGWRALPPRKPARRLGDWVDLTHAFAADVHRSAMFPPPTLSRVHEMPGDPLNVTRIETVVHIGTHVDAPSHFIIDGPNMDAVPLDRLMGPGVVLRIDKPPFGIVEPEDLAGAAPSIEPGDIVAIDLGWSGTWPGPAWGEHPYVSTEAAHWLVERQVKLLAVDTQTPDLPRMRRPPDFSWPVHCVLLAHGVLVGEQLANLTSLAGQRVEFLFGTIPIVGSDGAPARVLARPFIG